MTQTKIDYHDFPKIQIQINIEAEVTDEAKAYTAEFPINASDYLAMVKTAIEDEPWQWLEEMMQEDPIINVTVALLPSVASS